MILLDTHVVLWLLASVEQAPDLHLTPGAVALIAATRREGDRIGVADFSLWEIAMLATRGRIELPETLNHLLRRIEASFSMMRMDGRVAERAQQFSAAYPRDPADRIIGATALVYGATLVTADEAIRASGEVPTVW